jgi:hypothetical protein
MDVSEPVATESTIPTNQDDLSRNVQVSHQIISIINIDFRNKSIYVRILKTTLQIIMLESYPKQKNTL